MSDSRPYPSCGSARVLIVLLPLLLAPAGPAAAQSSAATEVQSPSDVVPLPNRVNQVMPSWLRVRAEFRERMEAIEGAGFSRGRDDLYWLSRLRFNVAATGRWISVHAQIQDARVARKDIGSGGVPFSAPADIRLAHVDLGVAGSLISARVGRQELAFGEQRLVGHVSWLNSARSFDAARVTVRSWGVQVDAFASSVVRIDTDDWDRSDGGSRFHGAYAVAGSWVSGSTVEPYFFWRSERERAVETGGVGRMRLGTTGVRMAGTLPTGIDYGSETVLQRGSVGSDSTRAWAQHLKLRTSTVKSARLVTEYNYATGDTDPTDGRRETFDPLYPTPHDKYGLADQVGWRNIHHVRAAVELAAIPRTPVTAAYHSWWLDSIADGLYAPSGARVAYAPDAPGRHVGHGVDVQVSRSLTPHLQVAGGYAYVHPGVFLKAATPGGSFNSTFVMLTYVFLAER